jgi:hypothetical protein
MASYKDASIIVYSDSAEFDKLHSPGAKPPHSGIYRCQQCNAEIVAEESRSFPPTHACAGKTQWKLIVYAMHAKPK